MTVGRSDGRTAVALLALLLVAVWPSGWLAAQDSQFGIRGLGTPGKWESVRARSTGGAFAPFDAFSPLIDASLADVRRMSANMTSGTSWRSVDAGGTQAALRGTRFPAMVITGPVTRRIVVGGGFSTYLDRSFGIVIHDTITLRGVQQPITDEITSDGAVSDLRVAVGARVRSRLALGLGLHRLTGSTRVVAKRSFADTANYRTSTARDEVAYGGMGGSASLLFDVTPDLRVAGWFRSDSKLRADIGGRLVAENDLPLMYGAGVQWRAGAQANVAGTVTWRNWAGAATVPNAHDTFNWSLGAEIGQPGSPFRFGLRGGQLPFGIGKTPTEVGYSAGLGRQFSGGRGRLDIGIERLQRSGAGLTERVWTFLLGLTVRP
ncbi:MAG TPA: hypothetical protein VK113_01815 [Gemmatimonadales bacterium]|nr:hypothetical protein [Gemmatimonadales bacterium]